MVILFTTETSNAQVEKHSIRSISNEGEVIVLEDGTAWTVKDSWDFYTTKAWSSYTTVLLINREKITNAKTDETVNVKLVSETENYGFHRSTDVSSQNNASLNNAFQQGVNLGAQEAEAEKQRQFDEQMAREHEEAETERLKLLLGHNSESTSTSEPQHKPKAQKIESRPIGQNRLLDLTESISEDSLWLTKAHYISGSKLLKDTVSWSGWTMSAQFLLNNLIESRDSLKSLLEFLQAPTNK